MFKFLIIALQILLLLTGCFSDKTEHEVESQAQNEGNQKTQELFAGLSQQHSDLKQVLPGYDISFPNDHASHPEYAVEWWYMTANLSDQQGKHYALQWTLFRFLGDATSTPWANEQQYMVHASLHTLEKSWFEERFARGGVGNAGVADSPFVAHLDNWRWVSAGDDLLPAKLSFTVEDNVELKLNLLTEKAYVLHGDNGYSQKLRDSSQASYYYSQPNIQVEGSISIDKELVLVSGQAWFDHEWSSTYLDKNTEGWDWFSIHIKDGSKLMLFNMRHGQQSDFWSGTLIRPNGQQEHLHEHDIKANVLEEHKVSGRILPLEWSLQLANHGIDIQVTPLKIDQWNPGIFSYYEGGIVINGSHQGVGFIELTGYESQ